MPHEQKCESSEGEPAGFDQRSGCSSAFTKSWAPFQILQPVESDSPVERLTKSQRGRSSRAVIARGEATAGERAISVRGYLSKDWVASGGEGRAVQSQESGEGELATDCDD